MPADLEFSGERFVPGITGEIAHEHWHRYAFARRFVAGKRVLDVACGEGYGSALLAGVADSILGVDIADAAIAHARDRYATLRNLRFEQGSAMRLPLPDAAVDVVVSFETIEHLEAADQPRMLAEIARVLTTDGMLVLSAPNPVEYSQARNYRNLFHLHEPTREELDTALAVSFPVRHWYRQRRYFGSALWSELAGPAAETWQGDAQRVDAAVPPAAMYFVVLASRGATARHAVPPALSLFSDRDDAELLRIDSRAAEVMRLDALLKTSDAARDRQATHVAHLETLVVYRDGIIEERDAHLAAARANQERTLAERDALARERDVMAGERDQTNKALTDAERSRAAFQAEAVRLERAIAAQERIITYRQSARWWLTLPWLRIKLWWKRVRDT